MAHTYGYVRVSTREQNEDRQLVAMQDFGVKDRDVFLDKQSGKILTGRHTGGFKKN